MAENFHLFLNVVVYFLNFSGIICMMFVMSVNFNYINMIRDIFTNWQLAPITDIINVESVCPDNYEYLFTYKWPGTREGCNCIGKTNLIDYIDYEDKLSTGSCPLALLNRGCKIVYDIKDKEIHSIDTNTICAKRNGFNYIANYTNIYEGHCPEGKINCGRIDSLSNILCIDESKSCPIIYQENNIHISSLRNNDYMLINILELIRSYSHSFIQFSVSQGDLCINNNEMNLLLKDIYELFNMRRYIKCSTMIDNIKYDNRYMPLLSFDTKYLFTNKNNTFIYDKITELPNFPTDFFNYSTTLYGRNYIGWRKQCEEFLTPFLDLEKILKRIEKYTVYYLIFSLLILIYCMLFIMILKEVLYEQYNIKILLILGHMIMIMTIYIFVSKDYSKMGNGIDLLYSLIKKRCSDDETNRLLIYLLDIFQQIKKLYLITLIFYIIMLLLSLFKILLIMYKIYKHRILRRIMQGNLNEFEMILLV